MPTDKQSKKLKDLGKRYNAICELFPGDQKYQNNVKNVSELYDMVEKAVNGDKKADAAKADAAKADAAKADDALDALEGAVEKLEEIAEFNRLQAKLGNENSGLRKKYNEYLMLNADGSSEYPELRTQYDDLKKMSAKVKPGNGSVAQYRTKLLEFEKALRQQEINDLRAKGEKLEQMHNAGNAGNAGPSTAAHRAEVTANVEIDFRALKAIAKQLPMVGELGIQLLKLRKIDSNKASGQDLKEFALLLNQYKNDQSNYYNQLSENDKKELDRILTKLNINPGSPASSMPVRQGAVATPSIVNAQAGEKLEYAGFLLNSDFCTLKLYLNLVRSTEKVFHRDLARLNAVQDPKKSDVEIAYKLLVENFNNLPNGAKEQVKEKMGIIKGRLENAKGNQIKINFS